MRLEASDGEILNTCNFACITGKCAIFSSILHNSHINHKPESNIIRKGMPCRFQQDIPRGSSTKIRRETVVQSYGPLCRSTFWGLEAEWMALKKNPFSWANLRSGKNLYQNFRFLAHTQLRWGGWKGRNLAAKGSDPFAAAHFGVWRPMGGPKRKTVPGGDIWDLGNWYMFDIKKREHSL